jgi:hypothetical protein
VGHPNAGLQRFAVGQHAAMMGGMTCQMNFWLVRSGPCLRLCAAVPPLGENDTGDASPLTVTYDSPGSFFSRLDTTIFEREKMDEIKTTVMQAIGTLDEVFTIEAIDFNPTQLGTLGLQDQPVRSPYSM